MKKNVIRILVACLALVMLFGLFGCAAKPVETQPQSGNTPATQPPVKETEDPMQGHEKVKLTIWLASIYSNSDALLDDEEIYIYQCAKRFNETYPWIQIDIVKTQGGGETAAMWKAAALAGTAPDMAEFWSSSTMTDLKDYAYPIHTLMDPAVCDNLLAWNTVTAPGDTEPMAVPASFGTISGIFYNKQIIADCGLDFENNPPRTVEDFFAACETIKAKGYLPIMQDEGKVNYLAAYLWQFWRSQAVGKEDITKLCNGEIKWSEHEGFKYCCEKYYEIFTKGYVNADCLTASDYQERWFAGEGAMNFSVSSFVSKYSAGLGAENLGFMLCPNLLPEAETVEHYNGAQGGAGQGIIVFKDTKHPEEVALFLNHLLSADEYVEYYNAKQNSIPNLKEVDTSKFKQDYPVMAVMASHASATDGYFSYTFGDAGTALGKYMDSVFAGEMTLEQMYVALDEASALYRQAQGLG